MTFSEQKTEKGYLYKVKDMFGEMEIESPNKLSTEKLDDVFMAIFDTGQSGENYIQGTKIYYKYKKATPWQKDSENKTLEKK
ncbi:MAG: hypothetical protein WD361_10520 [Gracilimonas sp.]